ncbi:hypothetical protein GCM10011487_16610 [Steroidobacter agaridevorans]|uniref:Carrier domain-containing protein n=1 Tax=Steroidobacter agaridevorans TaxID=2695856 RepID=A0A829Y9Q3_9GAMM|nr:non-ribosomal peptide synthetase [Steroidobacter agaridevorans]GFE79661.1 hypothetical protein GCM10011487_16610 [Steroidobacter agaridevorans]
MVDEIRAGDPHDSFPEDAAMFPAENVQGVYPLSSLQVGMLFHRLLDETRDTYVLSVLFEVRAREQIELLIGALQKVIDRHDILRTAILWENVPQPVQVVHRHASLHVEPLWVDPARSVLEQVKEQMRPGAQRLDLRSAPPMSLQTVADPRSEKWYALLHVHHVICDHESLNTILEEVRFFLEGRDHELPAAMALDDPAKQSLRDVSIQDVDAFFRRKLADIDEPTAPFGLLDTHGEAATIEEACEVLDAGLASRIRSWARRLGLTPARLFHAAWGLVVAHTSGRSDVVFGTVLLANRALRDRSQHSVGMSVNTLPLRLRLEGETLKDFLEQTQRELSELLQHAQASLADVQRCAGTNGQGPLFSALLNYRRNPRGQVTQAFNARGVSILARTDAWTNYPITMTVDDLDPAFVLTAYTDQRTSAQRFIGYLQQSLRAMMDALDDSPHVPALALNIVPDTELDQVIHSLNATAAPYPQQKLIHGLYVEQAARTPTQVAVAHGDRSLTYAELDRKSDLLAKYLQSQGVGPDRLVGLFVERSLDMIVGLMGVLKAGGAYLPVDPSYPPDRVRYMLEDARPVLVLTQQALRSQLPETSSRVMVLDEKPLEQLAAPETSLSDVASSSANLLYVIYTSGSTGRPKGTAMPHRSMVNLIEWHRHELPLREGACVLQFAALSFDVAFQEVFSTLCCGGTLVLVDEAVRKDPRSMIELLQARRIERLFVPPMMLQALADHAMTTGVAPAELRDVIAAGERLRVSPEIVGFFERISGCRLHNHYGPTETHVVTSATLSGSPQAWPALPSIGKPIANTRIYILDARRRPVPFGAIGEIYIAGANLARGYLNRQKLSCERFVADPFDDEPCARMYRTGDLGRWLGDGQIEYLGRNDEQVKIRGYRIELREIEAQLTLHEKVREAAVCVREDVTGAKKLVAYVTPRDRDVPTVDTLRAHLDGVLPAYMVPSAFVVLERFPLTPSGKLDRRNLPAPEISADAHEKYEPPSGGSEQTLAEIWKDLLRVSRVGRHDNFFDLGGHSILAMQAVTRIRSRLSIDIPIKLIFDYPILQQLSARLEEMIEQQSLDRLAVDGADMDRLAQTVASLPESRVAELLQELRMEGTSW